jgi:hypothetical protein
MAIVDQCPDQRVHLGDVTGRPGLVRRRQHVQRTVGGLEDALVAVRDGPERIPRLDGLRQHLVIDVGDVADERDVIAAVHEPAPQHVVVDAAAQMADMRTGLDGKPTQVHADLAGLARDEIPHGSGQRVIEAKRHRKRIAVFF